jgi:hypothetical protein
MRCYFVCDIGKAFVVFVSCQVRCPHISRSLRGLPGARFANLSGLFRQTPGTRREPHRASWGRGMFNTVYASQNFTKMRRSLMLRKTLMLAILAGAALLVAGPSPATAGLFSYGGCGGGCGGCGGGCGGCGGCYHHHCHYHHHGCGGGCGYVGGCGCGAPAPSCCAPAPTCCAPAPVASCCAPAPTCCAPAAPSCCAPSAPACGAPGVMAPGGMAPGPAHPPVQAAPAPPPEEPAPKPKA